MSHDNPFRLPSGPVDLQAVATDGTPGFAGGKKEGKAALAALGHDLNELQERLFAEGKSGSNRRLLLVLQGMDTSGKGGVLRHTIGLVDPQGVRIRSFKPPTEEERAHGFLWRIRQAAPQPGYLGVFDRSHYEDVLIARVHGMAPPDELESRYPAINDFERELVDGGTTILKCLLHISPEEQKARLLARLDDPAKHWKYNPGDVNERIHWSRYREAYEIALERTDTEYAPWHVIPSDKKWFKNLAVGQLLHDALTSMNPQWPAADFDPEVERKRLLDEAPLS